MVSRRHEQTSWSWDLLTLVMLKLLQLFCIVISRWPCTSDMLVENSLSMQILKFSSCNKFFCKIFVTFSNCFSHCCPCIANIRIWLSDWWKSWWEFPPVFLHVCVMSASMAYILNNHTVSLPVDHISLCLLPLHRHDFVFQVIMPMQITVWFSTMMSEEDLLVCNGQCPGKLLNNLQWSVRSLATYFKNSEVE